MKNGRSRATVLLKVGRKLELPAAQVMQLVLIQIRHFIGPSVDGLTCLKPNRVRDLLGAPEMLDCFFLTHSFMVREIHSPCQ